jgi:hypothetical protein
MGIYYSIPCTSVDLASWEHELQRFNQIKAAHDDYDQTVWTPAYEADKADNAAQGYPWPDDGLAEDERRSAIERFHQRRSQPGYVKPTNLTKEVDEQMEELQTEYLNAQDHLIEAVPAPGPGAVLIKLEIALKRTEDFSGLLPSHEDAILADLRRMAGE